MKPILLLLLSINFLSACGGPSHGTSSSSVPNRLNLDQATGLILLTDIQSKAISASSSSSFEGASIKMLAGMRASNSSANEVRDDSRDVKKLYKVTDGGVYVEVTYFDATGNELSMASVQPQDIININENFFLAQFLSMPAKMITEWVDELGVTQSAAEIKNIRVSYLVRKSDGKLYQLPPSEGRSEIVCYAHARNKQEAAQCGGWQIPVLSVMSDVVGQNQPLKDKLIIDDTIGIHRDQPRYYLSAGLNKDEIVIKHTFWENFNEDSNYYRVFLSDEESLRMVRLNAQDENYSQGISFLFASRSWWDGKKIINENRQINYPELPANFPTLVVVKKADDNSFLGVRTNKSGTTTVSKLTLDESSMTFNLEENVDQIPGNFNVYGNPNGLNDTRFYVDDFCDLSYYHDDLKIVTPIRDYTNLPLEIDLANDLNCTLSYTYGNTLVFSMEQTIYPYPETGRDNIYLIAHWDAASEQITELVVWKDSEIKFLLDGNYSEYSADRTTTQRSINPKTYTIEITDMLRLSDSSLVNLSIDIRTMEMSELVTKTESDTEIYILPLN